MLNKSVLNLLALTKSALTNSILSQPIENIDWHTVYSLALRQGISAIVLDGIGRLPVEVRPPKPILLQWIGQATMMERMYAKHGRR